MPTNLIPRLAAAMRRLGWEVDGSEQGSLHFVVGTSGAHFKPDNSDLLNARAIILMLDEIEKRFTLDDEISWYKRPDHHYLFVTWKKSSERVYLELSGKTRAEAVAEAFIKVVGE